MQATIGQPGRAAWAEAVSKAYGNCERRDKGKENCGGEEDRVGPGKIDLRNFLNNLVLQDEKHRLKRTDMPDGFDLSGAEPGLYARRLSTGRRELAIV